MDEPKVLVEENVGALLLGSLDTVVAALQQLQTKYSVDYAHLEISESDNPIDSEDEVVMHLWGVPHYSDATQQRLSQIEALLTQLPHEAAQALLRKKL